jgi:diacylglycerol kinase family enzyme
VSRSFTFLVNPTSGGGAAPAAVVPVARILREAGASRMRSLPKVYDGAHVELPEVTVVTGKRVELTADSSRPLPVGGDGEPLGHLPAREDQPAVVEVRPGALALIG